MESNKPPRFIGSHGEDWCVRPAELGPPDHVNGHVLHWLIVPGPPMSCYLAFHPPLTEAAEEHATFYHQHPDTWSIHIVLSGKGQQVIDDRCHDIGPGSVLYHGPGVRHCLRSLPGHHLAHISIQHPAAGYSFGRQWVVCPEAGTTDHYGDQSAFTKRFESVEALMKLMQSQEMFSGPRWMEFVQNRRPK